MNKAELQEVKIHHNNEAQYKENIANLNKGRSKGTKETK